jgi:hypothetical protein
LYKCFVNLCHVFLKIELAEEINEKNGGQRNSSISDVFLEHLLFRRNDFWNHQDYGDTTGVT